MQSYEKQNLKQIQNVGLTVKILHSVVEPSSIKTATEASGISTTLISRTHIKIFVSFKNNRSVV